MTQALLVCPTCGFERRLDVAQAYTQADLMCPSEDHPDTELTLLVPMSVDDTAGETKEDGDDQKPSEQD